MMCSKRQACWWTSASSTAKVSVKRRSARRWRRTTSRARREQARGGFPSYNRKMSSATFGAQEFRLRGLAFFAANPDLFEQMIDADVFVGGNWRTTIRGVGQRASHRMIGAVLRGIEGKVAVCKLDAAVSLACDVGVVRDHQNGVAGFVEIAEKIDDDLFVGFVEIAG